MSHKKSPKRFGHRKRRPNPVSRQVRERLRERDLRRLWYQGPADDRTEAKRTRKGAYIVQA